ncbi:LLM class F420-dependent oxidoreductase [Streptacidiphilus sp. P02-A3a]|uniref:LLM class F420-dependent oxidoreductase n=1 Tax=Streptacidiphilus sp. P02-A3a TaxID=2704468 RepID=UPI0015FE3DB2|nr:LLM class F420-dependent oxidoreductase [Streptacidiphilus sp. P02-A3a]QMU67376.1 LLM class F420-dependent oxidoreductase [Streptacidiphilus sp. P02-A3a]
MDFRIFIEPQQGASFARQSAAAQVAESLGYTGFFRSDHYLAVGAGDPLPGPTDSWLTLAGLALRTRTIRLGTLLSAATLRLPGPLSIQVAQVDEMSGGRVELGLGTGWYEREHTAYGIPFPAKRFGLLEEQLQILLGLWGTPPGKSFDFTGEHYRLSDCPALPKPVQRPHPPVIVGGRGTRRTPELAARYADEYNIGFVRPEAARAQFERVRDACREQGRDAATLTCSAALVVCCGATDAEVTARAHRMERGEAELRATGLTGSPAELVEKIGRYQEAGVERIYFQLLDLEDFDQLELIAHQVIPQLS